MEQKIITEYLRRSYFAVDGLWFVMLEEEFSLDTAFEMDERIWRVLPKIQARKAKELLKLEGTGLGDFLQAMKLKLEAEGYEYQENRLADNHAQIAISRCPWYEILKKANREHLAQRIADSICDPEFQVWMGEFDGDLSYNNISRCCTGDSVCLLDFSI